MCFPFLLPEDHLPAIERPYSFTEPHPLSNKIRFTSELNVLVPTRNGTFTLGDTTQIVATVKHSEIILPYGTISVLGDDDWRTAAWRTRWKIDGMLNFDVQKVGSILDREFSIRVGGMEYRLVHGAGGMWSYQYSVLVIQENGHAVQHRKVMAINRKQPWPFCPMRYTLKFSEEVSVPLVACVAYIFFDFELTSAGGAPP